MRKTTKNNSIALVRCILFIISCSCEIYIFVFIFMFIRSDGHRRLVKRFSKVLGAFQTSYDAPPGTGRSPLKSYDLNFTPKLSSASPMCANAGRAPPGHRTVPGQCYFTLNDTSKCHTCAVEF